MVRLRGTIQSTLMKHGLHFNSSVVRLRGFLEFGSESSLHPFQFQCGAIEGVHDEVIAEVLKVFQFQCGAIEGPAAKRES